MKKFFSICLVLFFTLNVVCFSSCSLSSRLEKQNREAEEQENKIINQLKNAVSFRDILVYAHGRQNDLDYQDLGLEDLMSEKVIEFFFSDENQVGGTYYYKEYNIPGSGGAMMYGNSSEDTRTVYIDKDAREVYIAPADVMDGKDPSVLPQLANAQEYRYRVISGGCTDSSWNKVDLLHYFNHMEVDLKGPNNLEITLGFIEDGSIIKLDNRLPDMGENYDFIRCYLSDEYEAEKNAQKEYAEKLK